MVQPRPTKPEQSKRQIANEITAQWQESRICGPLYNNSRPIVSCMRYELFDGGFQDLMTYAHECLHVSFIYISPHLYKSHDLNLSGPKQVLYL